MDLKIMGKTILSFYGSLETLNNAIENLVKKTTQNSFYRSGFKNDTTLDISNKLLKLLNEKEKIINLKVICEKCVNMLNEKERKVLSLFYFDGASIKSISEVLNVSLRTIFRIKNLALCGFENALKYYGYDSNYFEKNFNDQKWLFDYYTFEENEYKFYFNKKQNKCSNDEKLSRVIDKSDKEYVNNLNYENSSLKMVDYLDLDESESKRTQCSFERGKIIGKLLREIKYTFNNSKSNLKIAS